VKIVNFFFILHNIYTRSIDMLMKLTEVECGNKLVLLLHFVEYGFKMLNRFVMLCAVCLSFLLEQLDCNMGK
jgi:hypothetical protein